MLFVVHVFSVQFVFSSNEKTVMLSSFVFTERQKRRPIIYNNQQKSILMEVLFLTIIIFLLRIASLKVKILIKMSEMQHVNSELPAFQLAIMRYKLATVSKRTSEL